MNHTLRIKIKNIECLHKSAELDKFDELYGVVRLYAAHTQNGQVVQTENSAQAKSSNIVSNIKKGTKVQLAPDEYRFDLGESQAFVLSFMLVEADNRKLFESVKAGKTDMVFPKINIEEMLNRVIGTVMPVNNASSGANGNDPLKATTGGSIMTWINILVDSLRLVFRSLTQDDLMGEQTVSEAVKAGTHTVPFEFKKAVAHYRGELEISIEGKAQA